MVSKEATKAELELRRWMRRAGKVLVAYSGGVDSSFLAYCATDELGYENAIAATGISPSVSEFQLTLAREIALENGFNHQIQSTHEVENPKYRANDGIRCYFCKDELYGRLTEMRDSLYPGYVIVDGTNFDDLKDVRHGMRAAEEKDVRSPLLETQIGKPLIRELSKHYGLRTWDMPASPCLASRVQVGVSVTARRLHLVEQGEEILRNAGFREFRLRVSEKNAKIQIGTAEMQEIDFAVKIAGLPEKIKRLGFNRVLIDPEGYKMGSANIPTTV